MAIFVDFPNLNPKERNEVVKLLFDKLRRAVYYLFMIISGVKNRHKGSR